MELENKCMLLVEWSCYVMGRVQIYIGGRDERELNILYYYWLNNMVVGVN